jgi:hypothetical protein
LAFEGEDMTCSRPPPRREQNIARGWRGNICRLSLLSQATRRANQSPALSFACPAPFAKIFCFSEDANHLICNPVPLLRGALRNVTKRGAGCGGRWVRA